MNSNVDACPSYFKHLLPRDDQIHASPIKEETYHAIMERSMEILTRNFRKLRAFAMVCLNLITGERNKELRLADIDNLDTVDWTLMVRHPKGEGSYRRQHPRLWIHPDARSILTDT